jgi:hypothetical protein
MVNLRAVAVPRFPAHESAQIVANYCAMIITQSMD